MRVELANPGLLLKPAMFAQVELVVSARGPMVSVPLSAVIDSGTRQIVLVQQGEGRFAPRQVKLGARSDNYVEVVDGVKDGEQGVVAVSYTHLDVYKRQGMRRSPKVKGGGAGGVAATTATVPLLPGDPRLHAESTVTEVIAAQHGGHDGHRE